MDSPNNSYMEQDSYDNAPELDNTQSSQPQTQSTQENSQEPTAAMDSHLWGYLQALNPVLSRIDFWKIHPRYSIGRNRDNNTVVLPGFKVSNQHCIIAWDGESKGTSVLVTDLSSNGTFINGTKVGKNQTRILRDGSEIAFGTTLPQLQNGGIEDYRFIYRHTASGPPTSGLHAYYDLEGELGKGSFATVMKAVSRATGEWFAVKMIKDKGRGGTSSNRSSMFAREISVMQTLKHPNICQLHEVFYEDENDISLVLELVEGGDLLEYVLKSPDGVGDVDAKHITYQICHAMAYIHSKGVAHRDLKPENILLTKHRPPIVKVADFGLAKMVDSLTMLRTMCGTPAYLAPEVVSQQPFSEGYDNLVDSWSVGVIVFSIFARLTGSSPFMENDDIKDISTRVLTRTINWHLLTMYDVSADAKDFIRRLLERDPTTRMSLTDALTHEWLSTYTPIHDLDLPSFTPSVYFPPPTGTASKPASVNQNNGGLATGATSGFVGLQIDSPSLDEIPGMTGGIKRDGSRLQRRADIIANAAEGNGDILQPSQNMIDHAASQEQIDVPETSKGANKRVHAELSVLPEDNQDADMDGNSDNDDASQSGKGKGRATSARSPPKRGERTTDDDEDSPQPPRRSSRNPPSKIARRT